MDPFQFNGETGAYENREHVRKSDTNMFCDMVLKTLVSEHVATT